MFSFARFGERMSKVTRWWLLLVLVHAGNANTNFSGWFSLFGSPRHFCVSVSDLGMTWTFIWLDKLSYSRPSDMRILIWGPWTFINICPSNHLSLTPSNLVVFLYSPTVAIGQRWRKSLILFRKLSSTPLVPQQTPTNANASHSNIQPTEEPGEVCHTHTPFSFFRI